MRILHCLSGAAGQPSIISKAQRELGYKSHCATISASKFGYEYDILIQDDKTVLRYIKFLSEIIDDYDIFHFYSRPFFLLDSRYPEFPNYLDLLVLKAAGKTVIFNYRGSEVRSASKFTKFSPHNYVLENPEEIFSHYPDNTIEHFYNFITSVSNEVLVPDPELQSYAPSGKIVNRAINLDLWNYLETNNSKLKIVHAPSRRGVKGTEIILKVINELQSEGFDFNFELIENLSNHEARKRYEECDILIDQLRIGWHGVLAVECMALGKIVITYLREDLKEHTKNIPLINASPITLKNELKILLKMNKDEIEHLKKLTRIYCEENHSDKVIAQELIAIYKESMGKTINTAGVLNYLRHQTVLSRSLKYNIKRSFTRFKTKVLNGFKFLKRNGLNETIKKVIKHST
jgi:hypothetical protein